MAVKMAEGIKIPSDSLVIEMGNVEYRPREGQHVVFRGRIPVWMAHAIEKSFRVVWDSQGVPDDEALERMWAAMSAALQHIVVDWDWADDDGEMIPLPDGNGEHLASTLSGEEIDWLFEQYLTRQRRSQIKKKGLSLNTMNGSGTEQEAPPTEQTS